MKWRDVVIGALVALAVTILGGLAVYSLTYAPPAKEQIGYFIDEPVVFATQDTEISLFSARVSNVGEKSAQDVKAVIRLPGDLHVADYKAQLSTGSAGEIDVKAGRDSLTIHAPVLVPSETINISILTEGTLYMEPSMSVRSSSSVGIPNPVIEKDNSVASFLVPVLSLIAIGIPTALALFILWQRRFEISREVNNFAFLCIHQGMTKEAEEILKGFMKTKGAGTYEMLNYALAAGLNGRLDDARKLFVAGEWAARTRRTRGLAQFNRCVLDISQEDTSGAKRHLIEAFSLSSRQVAEYCRLSIWIKQAMEGDPEFARLVKSSGQ